MKKILLMLMLMLALAPVAYAGDDVLTIGEAQTKSTRQFYVTGSGSIDSLLSVPTYGTEGFEIVFIEVHLSAAGGADDFTITKDSAFGTEYDVLLLSQDMTSVTDLRQYYDPGEMFLSNLDSLVVAWTNGSARTYGLVIGYKLK